MTTTIRWLIVHTSFFNGGLLFSTLTLSAIALVSLYSFLLLVKTKFVVSGSFGGMYSSFRGGYAAFLTVLRSRRDALRSMDALLNSHFHHHLANRLCLCIYDIRR